MKEMKRILALFLCLVMLVGVLPVSAFAAPGNNGKGPGDKNPGKGPHKEPVIVETVPVTEETTAPSEETTPVTEETTAPSEETTPVTEETTAPSEETTPVTEETTPVTEETTPVTEQTEPPVIAVTGITLDQTALEVGVGAEPVTLVATVLPEDATDKTVTWTSSEPGVAAVADGILTFGYMGEAVITATAGEFSATCTVTVGEGEISIYPALNGENYVDAAIIFSDLHTSQSDYKQTTINNVFGKLANTGLEFSSVTSAGDAFSMNSSTYSGAKTSTITTAIRGALEDSDIPVNYVWSDHDRKVDDGGSLIDPTSHLAYGAGADGKYGTDDDANYYIYALSMGDLCSYDRYSAGFNTDKGHDRTASGFTASVDDAITNFKADAAKLKKDRPLFIVSHQPLFDNRNDNAFAEKWFDAISLVAEEMDVTFFFGHNHYYDVASDYVYEKGETMSVATEENWDTYQTGQGTKYSKDLGGEDRKLNFTHLCAGYLSPATESSTTRKGTAVAITIYEDSIKYTAYDKDGIYDSNAQYALNLDVKRGEYMEADLGEVETPVVPETPETPVVPETPETPEVVPPVEDSNNTGVSVTSPKVEEVKAEVNTTSAVVKAAVENLLTNYISYDITVKGDFEEGDVAVVAMPAPKDLKNPAVYFVDTDGTTERKSVLSYADGVITFETDHFSTYVVGDLTIELDSQNATVAGSLGSVNNTNASMDSVQASGNYFAIYVNQKSDYKYLTNNTNGDGLEIAGSDPKEYWYITYDGTNYYIQDGGPDGKYLSIGAGTAQLVTEKHALTLERPNKNYWTIQDQTTAQYLNQYNGSGSNMAAGFRKGADDKASCWQLRLVNRNPDQAYSVDASNVTDAAALSGQTVTLSSKLYRTQDGANKTQITNGWTVSYSLVEGKGDPDVISGIRNGVATLSGTEGAAVVRATYTNNNNQSLIAYTEFVVHAKVPTFSMEIVSPASTEMKIGAALNLNAITRMNGSNTNLGTVTWSIPAEQQSVATVTADGLITARSEGEVTVTATYTDPLGGVHTDTVTLKVLPPVYALYITEPASTTVKVGNQLQLNAMATVDSDLVQNPAIIWSIPEDQQTIATVDPATGLVEAKSEGNVTVTATYTDPTGKAHTDSVDLQVKMPVYDLKIVEPESDNVKVGNTLQMSAIATVDGDPIEDAKIYWSIPENQLSVADVTAEGLITAKSEGEVTVTAIWEDGLGTVHTKTYTINVIDALWVLSLEKPVLDEDGKNVYATDEDGKQLLDDDGKPYYATTDITAPIVIKDVKENETYENVWAVITKDGVNLGTLNEDELPNLHFISSNPGIAKVDETTGKVTFTGARGTVSITAVYDYYISEDGATKRSVSDTVIFSVSDNNYYVPEDGTDDFPEYPNKGAIRFDKNATAVGNFSQTGVTQVELSMTGVPMQKGIDVIVMLDTSTSMDRCIHCGNKKGDRTNPCTCGDNFRSRLTEMNAALDKMIDLFYEKNPDGSDQDIRIAIRDFNGVGTGATAWDSRDRTIDADGLGIAMSVKSQDMSASAFLDVAKNYDTLKGTAYNFTTTKNGTNYDYAFDSIYQLGHNIKAANQAAGVERELYVVFMSDGAPNYFNYYATQGGNSRYEDWNWWLTGAIGRNVTVTNIDGETSTFNSVQLANIVQNTSHYHYYNAATNNQHRMANAVKGSPKDEFEVIRKSTAGMTGNRLDGSTKPLLTSLGNDMYNLPGLGATMYSIAFTPGDDGGIKSGSMLHVLKDIASSSNHYYEATKTGALEDAFGAIAGDIIEAAKDVKVVDTMGGKYTMVFDFPNTGVKEALGGANADQEFYVEVKDYTLTPVDANGNTVDKNSTNIADYKRGDSESLIKLYLGTNTDGSYYAATQAGSAGGANKFAAPVFTEEAIGSKRYWTTDSTKADTYKDANGDVHYAAAVPVDTTTTYYFVKAGNGTHNIASGAYAYGTPTVETTNVHVDNTTQTVETTTCQNLIIATRYFAYNAATKEMVWTTEKLSTSELAISYFLYLEKSGGWAGSPDETIPGTYPTNKAAYLYYTNFNGKECEQVFPVPQQTWNGAQVSYVFYLVNKNGQPVNRAGVVVPFSEAVYVTDVNTYAIVWNRLEQSAGLEAVRLAEELVPPVYKLYDESARYSVHVYEDEKYVNLNNHFVIESTSNVNTTYVFNTKADAVKYRVPGAYVANDGIANSGQQNYLCKDYNVTNATYEEVIEDGVTYYKVTAATYTGEHKQWEPGQDDTYTGGTKLGQYVYYVDGEGKVYTIVVKADGNEVEPGFDFSNTTVAFAVQWVPELAEDAVVMDYGLDVIIDVTTNDAMNSTVAGVRKAAPQGITMNSGTYNAARNNLVDVTLENAYSETVNIGTASVANKNAVRFSLNKTEGMQFSEPVEFYYESDVQYQNDQGTTISTSMYSKVTVIPATTVYYEDEYVTLKTITTDANGNKKETAGWDTNSVHATATQAQDRPGESKISETLDADNIYGYDKAYAEMSTHSMNGAAMVNVKKGTSAKAEFAFWGTGFDIVSLTDDTTGTILVDVYEWKDGAWKLTDYFDMVDTYYGMDKNGTLTENTYNALYQVPVIKMLDMPYAKYKAVITVSYMEFADHNKDEEGYNFYLDAIRIYDPCGTTYGEDGNIDQVAQKAYKADGEAWPVYQELRNSLITSTDFSSGFADDGEVNGIVFIDGEEETLSVADYISYGPNNEIYLAPGQFIAFNLDLDAYTTVMTTNGTTETVSSVASVQVGIKSANGEPVQYGIFDGAELDAENGSSADVETRANKEIATSADMYYDITDLKDKTIVIYNGSEEGIMSLTNVKITFTSKPADTSKLFYVDYDTIVKILEDLKVSSGKTESGSTSSSDENENLVITAPEIVVVGKTFTVTVTCTEEVENVTINGEDAEPSADGLTWTAELVAEGVNGEMTVTAVADETRASVTVKVSDVPHVEAEMPQTVKAGDEYIVSVITNVSTAPVVKRGTETVEPDDEGEDGIWTYTVTAGTEDETWVITVTNEDGISASVKGTVGVYQYFVPKDFDQSTDITLSNSNPYVNQEVTVTITTGQDVDAVMVDDVLVTTYRTKGNQRVWTAKVSHDEVGMHGFNIVLYNADGHPSAPISRAINVQAAPPAAQIVTNLINTIANLIKGWFGW